MADLKRESEAVWHGIAAIVTPTAGGFPTLADMDADPIGPNSQLGYYTNFMNLLDLCAVAMPTGESPGGLPFGITWIAPRDTDKALIDIAMNGPTEGRARYPYRAAQDDGGPSGTTDPTQNRISLLLFGAHMNGLLLNPQVLGLGATFLGEVQTAEKYKMVYLPEPAPHRPGIVRVSEGGVSILAEEWSFPKSALGEFLSTIQQPLGLGQIELSNGRKVHGFLCEASAAQTAQDISASGGWRGYLSSL